MATRFRLDAGDLRFCLRGAPVPGVDFTLHNYYGSVAGRAVPLILLIVALAGILGFSQGFRLIDTVGLLISGAVAGASMAAIAARRRKQ